MRISISIVPLLFLVCAGCGTADDRSGGVASKLSGDNVDSDPPSTASSATVCIFRGSGCACSGTLISPTLVLTAAHCVTNWSTSTVIRDYGTGLASSSSISACDVHPNAVGVTETISGCDDPDFTAAPLTSYEHQYDIALLTLSAPVTAEPRLLGPPRSCLRNTTAPPALLLRGYGTNGVARRLMRLTGHAGSSGGGNFAERLVVDPGPGAIEDGDSGGTYTTTDPSSPVIGIVSNEAFGALLWAAPGTVGLASPHDWLWDLLDPTGDCVLGSTDDCVLPGESSPLSDTDADGLPDVRDLCPNSGPPSGTPCAGQHCDVDGDFVGDECDDFDSGALTACNHDDLDADGIPSLLDPCPTVPDSMTSSADLDDDGVPDSCDVCPGLDDTLVDEGEDDDGDGVPDACDNCPIANPSQANCNLDMELLHELTVAGDACDPNPCPSAEPLVDDEIETISSVEFAMTNRAIVGHGVAIGATEGTLRTGFRFCPCEVEGDTPFDRGTCALPDPFGSDCALESSEYTDRESPWKPMSIGWNGETAHTDSYPGGGATYQEIVTGYAAPDDPFFCGDPPTPCSRLFEGTWNFTGDATLTGTLITETLGERTRAVVWSRGVSYATADDDMVPFGCNVPNDCPALDGDLNNHYWSGEAV